MSMSLKIQSQHHMKYENYTDFPKLKKIINHQKYEITIYENQSDLKNRLICDCTRDGITKYNVPILIAHDYDNRPINSHNLTYYKDFNAFVLGNYGLKGGMRQQETKGEISQLIQDKISNPEKTLSPEESIAVLMECMNLGKVEAEKSKGKELTIFIGNTGAGKSTLINYLYGCDMESIDYQTLGGKVIAVKPKSKGGKHEEVIKIGHTKKSETFMPQVVEDVGQQITYCDCPGFLDNRGLEINIANAVNLRRVLIQAKSVKIVMLINYSSLRADRGKSLSTMLKIVCDLFGSKESLTEYKESILLGVTNVPRKHPDETTFSLDVIKKWIQDPNTQDLSEKNCINILSERIFVYDPLERQLEYQSLKRSDLMQNIKNLSPICNPMDIFKTVLTLEDKGGLAAISKQISERIHESLRNQNFKQASQYFISLKQLEIMQHQNVTELVSDSCQKIVGYFEEIISNFYKQIADSKEEFFNINEAEKTVQYVKKGIEYFDEQIKSQVKMSELEKRYNDYKIKIEAINKRREINTLKEKFDKLFEKKDFTNAKSKMDELKEKTEAFDKDYKDAGVTQSIKVENLDVSLKKEKAQDSANKISNLKTEFDKLIEEKKFEQADKKKDELKKEIETFDKDHKGAGVTQSIKVEKLDLSLKKAKAQDSANKISNLKIDFDKLIDKQDFKKQDFADADKKKAELKKEIETFKKDYENAGVSQLIEVEDLEKKLKKAKAQYSAKEISNLKEGFDKLIEEKNFEQADKKKDELKKEIETFEKDYKDTGISQPNIKVNEVVKDAFKSKILCSEQLNVDHIKRYKNIIDISDFNDEIKKKYGKLFQQAINEQIESYYLITKSSGQCDGWGLTVHTNFSGDRRDDSSTYAIVHENFKGRWKIEPANLNEQTYRIINNGQRDGWDLAAHRNFSGDRRDDSSTYAMVHKNFEPHWEIKKSVCDSYTIKKKGGQCNGCGLTAHRNFSGDRRDDSSTYAIVHENFPSDWKIY